MRRLALSIGIFALGAGIVLLAGCGGENKTSDTTPNSKQSSKEKMR